MRLIKFLLKLPASSVALILIPLAVIFMIISMTSCKQTVDNKSVKIAFLHHSTGQHIWNGNGSTPVSKLAARVSTRLSYKFYKKPALPASFKRYNKENNTDYVINELVFPKSSPYGWKNYPYDYYNIWVKNSGDQAFMEEPTLEMLTKEYQVIIFKHCFPVSNIQPDKDTADINSDYKSIANYKLQYKALKEKLSEFPDTKFILFTGAVQVKSQISEEEASRAKEFFKWVIEEWDSPEDNIFIWDFYNLQTEGGIYFKANSAYSETDSHPNDIFSGYASGLLFERIIDIVKTNGSETTLTGERK